MKIRKWGLNRKFGAQVCLGIGMVAFAGAALALTIGTMASHVTATFDNIGKLITAGSYIAGLGFAVGAILMFKQHKDNPTQITIGKPIGLLLIAASLLFMPTLLKALGSTMFGGASTSGAKGTSIGSTSS